MSNIFRNIRKRSNGIEGINIAKAITCFAIASTISIMPTYAQNITTDGNTNTTIQSCGKISNISTSTIKGSTGFNSFNKFNVLEDTTVNLILPGSTSKLINLIKEGPSNINGTLNSIQNGQVGGDIFLVNPYGFIVGNSGVINVGGLTVATPTVDFVDNFFTAPGVIDENKLNALKNN